MSSYRAQEAIEARRRTLRSIFIFIIVITLPFYCLGLILWGTAPRALATATPQPSSTPGSIIVTATPIPSNTPSGPASITPFTFVPVTTVSFPTQSQFTSIPVTRFLSPTPTFFVPPTSAPVPTQPPPQPTQPPPPTSAPLPTEPPLMPPTDTPGP